MISDDDHSPQKINAPNVYVLPLGGTKSDCSANDDQKSFNPAPDQEELLKYMAGISAELSRLCASSNFDVLAYFFEMAHIEASERRKALKKTPF